MRCWCCHESRGDMMGSYLCPDCRSCEHFKCSRLTDEQFQDYIDTFKEFEELRKTLS